MVPNRSEYCFQYFEIEMLYIKYVAEKLLKMDVLNKHAHQVY